MKFTKEEIKLMLTALDGVSFTANVTNIVEVTKMISTITNLKEKLQKELEPKPKK